MKQIINLTKSPFHVEVFLWETPAEMHKKAKGKKDYLAIYKPKYSIAFPKVKVFPKLGEIHLNKENLGAGIISHEVLHCVFDWWDKLHNGGIALEHHDDQEKACFHQGELVKKIINWLMEIDEWKSKS